MTTQEVIQLMHEGQHSAEKISEWANCSVKYVNYLYQQHCAGLLEI